MNMIDISTDFTQSPHPSFQPPPVRGRGYREGEPVLQSSTEQWEMHFAQTSAAVHWWWVPAHLYEQQISIGVTAVTQACCRPVLQSRTEQWELHFAQTSAAVHWYWVTAHLYEHQIFIGVIAATQACCEPVLQSSTGQCAGHFAKTSAAVHWW